jgi:L-lactate oxidase
MSTSRRDLLKLAGAGAASAALAAAGFVWAQVKEEAENEPVTIVRKGIDKQIEVINVDLLEAEARRRLSEVVYVFIAHGAGEQWTLHENRRAFEDYVFTPHRIGGALRRQPVSASQPRP